MKLVSAVAVFLLTSNAWGSDYSARVGVHSEHDVLTLAARGVQFLDARVESRISSDGTTHFRVQYLPENGFVTVLDKREDFASLRNAGFDVGESHEWKDLEPHPDHVLDTIPNQFGWPRTIFNGLSLYENSPTVADMDLNGQLDLSITNAWGSFNPTVPPYLIVWRRNGAYLSGFPVALQPGQMQSSADAGISAMGDIVGDGKLEIVCGDENGYLYAFHHDGSVVTGFPLSYGGSMGVYTPALADVDHDGKCEIAVISHQWDSPYASAQLHLLKVTATGPVEMPGFPISFERGASNSPALGDIDGDDSIEVVLCTGGVSDGSVLSKVIAYSPTGQVKPGFPWIAGRNSIGCSPTLYDLDRDGKLEIIVRVKPDNNVNGFYAIRYDGTLMAGFPFPITYGNPDACVAVGDMDGDGNPELAYGGVEAVDSGKVWVYNLSGTLLPGFPARVYRTWVDGSVAIADVDGDGKGDVVCGTNGVSSAPGRICAFNYRGETISGFPISPGNPILNSFTTHVTMVDIDGDGGTDIFAGRVDKNVYGWDTPGVYDSVHVWSTFKGNAARTGGQLRSPYLVSVGEESARPLSFSLDQNYPNPFNPSTQIRFTLAVEARTQVQIFDLLGRRVATLIDGVLARGSHVAEWDASGMATGAYFCRLTSGQSVAVSRLLLLR
jgi:hypothetical protein